MSQVEGRGASSGSYPLMIAINKFFKVWLYCICYRYTAVLLFWKVVSAFSDVSDGLISWKKMWQNLVPKHQSSLFLEESVSPSPSPFTPFSSCGWKGIV